MATKKYTIKKDKGRKVIVNVNWLATTNENQSAEKLIDVSELEPHPVTGKPCIGVKVIYVKGAVSASDFSSGLFSAYILKDDNSVITSFHQDCPMRNFANYSESSNSGQNPIGTGIAAGDLKIGIGTNIAKSNGGATGALNAGDHVDLDIKCIKQYAT